jgi:MscS family membrane protein
MLYTLNISFLDRNFKQIIATLIVVIVFIVLRVITKSFIKGFGRKTHLSETRMNLVIKYIDFLIMLLGIVSLITIWGVNGEQIFLVLSSVFTIIGVAFFAQWSHLSNITAGIILFFSFPFKIGDRIKMLDKDFPIEGEIIDIKSFYTLIKTLDGEEISYPNNLLLQKGIAIIVNQYTDEKEFTD